jgi:hypothetical protein
MAAVGGAATMPLPPAREQLVAEALPPVDVPNPMNSRKSTLF